MLLPSGLQRTNETSSLRTLKNIKNPQGFHLPRNALYGLSCYYHYLCEGIYLPSSEFPWQACLLAARQSIDFWKKKLLCFGSVHMLMFFSSSLLIVNDTISWSRDLGWEHDWLESVAVDTRSSMSGSSLIRQRIPRSNDWSSKKFTRLCSTNAKKAWQGDEAHSGAFCKCHWRIPV